MQSHGLGKSAPPAYGRILLLDAKGRPIFFNSAATQILDGNDGLVLRAHGLRCEAPSEDKRLGSLVASALAAADRKRSAEPGSLLISRRLRRPLQLLVAPFLLDAAHAPRGAAAIISIADPEATVHLPSQILREFYGLTQAETQLARSLLEGTS